MNYNSLAKKLKKQLYKKSLYEFVKAFWNTCDPSTFIDGVLIQFYCETFQYFCRDWVGYKDVDVKVPPASDNVDVIDVRGATRNLNINVPPRHTKSMIFNVFGPTWLWLSYPITAVSVSHNTALASTMNKKRAKIIHSELFQELFGDDIHLTSEGAYALGTTEGGDLRSQARESFTGFGADVIINDDLTNAETARRDQAEMLSAWSYFQNTMPSRINNPDKCLILNIQQRLAPNDITGHILDDPKLSARYTHIVIPAIFQKDTFIVCPISGRILFFPKGGGLWPERFKDNYESLRDQVGPAVFETQYLQNPIASDKTVIKQSMLECLNATECPKITEADIVFASHDFPVKDKDTSDFLGSILGYKVGSMLYIIDCLEKRMAFKASVTYVQKIDSLYPGAVQVIEDKGNGSPVLQQLQDAVAGMQAFSPGTRSKMQRLESASLYVISKNVVFVKTKFDKQSGKYVFTDGMQNLIKRLCDFPFVEHDDIVDAFSQLVLFVFMDRLHMVYGRSFGNGNIISLPENINQAYYNVFFNKEGDIWKACKIAVLYGVQTRFIVKDELRFKASVTDGLKKLHEFAPTAAAFIDCSATDGLYGMFEGFSIERYDVEDFDSSVATLNKAFSNKTMLVAAHCRYVIADIEMFKYSMTKDESSKYRTKKDGFVACLRVALKLN